MNPSTDVGDAVRILNWSAKNRLYVADALEQYQQSNSLKGYVVDFVEKWAEQLGIQLFYNNNIYAEEGASTIICYRDSNDDCDFSALLEGGDPCAGCEYRRDYRFTYKEPVLDGIEDVIKKFHSIADQLYELKALACEASGSKIRRYVQIDNHFYREYSLPSYIAHSPVDKTESDLILSGDLPIVQLSSAKFKERKVRPITDEEFVWALDFIYTHYGLRVTTDTDSLLKSWCLS